MNANTMNDGTAKLKINKNEKGDLAHLVNSFLRAINSSI
jgi:hypothetical protein